MCKEMKRGEVPKGENINRGEDKKKLVELCFEIKALNDFEFNLVCDLFLIISDINKRRYTEIFIEKLIELREEIDD